MNNVPGRRKAGIAELVHATHAAQAHIEDKLDTVGLSVTRLAALNALREAGDSMPLGQLAERLACVKSNITQLVDRLEADGLVARQSDPNDRRTKLAVLTDAGKRAWKEGRGIQEQAEHELFGGLNEDEAHQLVSLIEKVRLRSR